MIPSRIVIDVAMGSGPFQALALWTVPVAAANGKFPLAALWAKLVMGS